MSPSIAIIGAGPAGLTLAKILDSSAATKGCFTIFESDTSANARVHRGGSLDLHRDSGLAALKRAGVYDEFLNYARFGGGEDLIISDKNGVDYIRHVSAVPDEKIDKYNPGKYSRPEIDRGDLMDMLLQSVPPETVKWGHRAASVSEDGVMTFTDGKTAGPFDLIVGADGAWSKVRIAIGSPTPRFSGISGFQLRVLDAEARHPEVANSIGNANRFCYSDGKSLSGQKLGDGSYLLGLWNRKPETWPEELKASCGGDPVKIRAAILQEYSDWCPELRSWIEASEPSEVYQKGWGLTEIPFEQGPKWTHKKGFTLIGDAAHLMTPFAGEGVNVGLLDALTLGTEIVSAVSQGGNASGLDTAVRVYEEDLFPRAHAIMLETARNKFLMFHNSAPGFFASQWKAAIEAAKKTEKLTPADEGKRPDFHTSIEEGLGVLRQLAAVGFTW